MEQYNRSLHIRTKAVELLKVHCIDTTCEIKIPELISFLEYDITYHFADLKGLAGFTCYDHADNRYRIFLDSVTSENCPPRTSFTMAHELGHIVLGHFDISLSNSIFIGHPFFEVEANLFADEILMPTSHIIRRRMDAKEIVETYNVSISAAQNKIKYLKANPLYSQEKALNHALRIVCTNPIFSTYSTYSTYNNYMIKKLHNAWLDPDSEWG